MRDTSEIIETLRNVRQTKGLSQKELSNRAGIPQSHLSKIESGTVDIQLSSLVQIARALDLELKLVPRKALSAVESIVQTTNGFPRDRTEQALSEIRKANKWVEELSHTPLPERTQHDLQKVALVLTRLRNLNFDTDSFVRLKEQLQGINHITEGVKAQQLIKRLTTLRNELAHRTHLSQDEQRPAYSLEDDENE